MPTVNCPSCGGKVDFKSSISLLAVCPYCRSQLLRTDLKVEDLGKVAQLQQDGSPLQLGVRGEYRRLDFTLIGRVQLKYDAGFWNEWYALFGDGRFGWLGEAQGLYSVSFTAEAAALPKLKELNVGRIVRIGGADYKVRDIEEAEYVSAEGELPYRPPLGERGRFADCSGDKGGFATIDYSEDEPAAYTGEYVEFDALKLAGLKEIEGWQ